MIINLICAFILSCVIALADSPTVYVGDRYQHRIAAITTDSAGNTYATGSRIFPYPAQQGTYSVLPTEKSEVFVAKLAARTNERVWIRYFSGKETDAGTAIALDRDGSIYVAGNTSSPNFPLLNPLESQTSGPYASTGFLLKLSNDGLHLLWSTYYGQSGTTISSIGVAPGSTVVLGGSIRLNGFGDTQAFVTKIDPSANRVLWEQRYNGGQLACSGGSSCFTSAHTTSATIGIDTLGNIYAAGNTNTLDLPTTPGAFRENGYGPYVRKYSAAGAVIWSTYLSDNRFGVTNPVSPADTLNAIAVGPDNSLYFTGGGSANWPTTQGAYTTKYEGPGLRNAYVAKMNTEGTALLYSTFLHHNNADPNSIAVDAGGNAFVSGNNSLASSEPDYISSVNASGTALLGDNTYRNGSRGSKISLDTAGLIHAVGAKAGIITLVDRTLAPSGLSGIANAAGTGVVGRVARGELISIYGWSLGDRVFIDDVPATVFYASSVQMNTIVPFAPRSNDRITISVRKDGVETARAIVALTDTQPEFFQLPTGQAASLNEDGSVNSQTNPAKLGSIITVWGTGAPGWARETREGSVNPDSPLQYLNVSAIADYKETVSTFAGAAPGLPAGIFQVNIKLPETHFGPNQVEIYPVSGLEISSPVFVYVKP
jgi:uncharacterized protein (TIGR03437 family)